MHTDSTNSRQRSKADVVCFGILTPALVVTVDELPAVNAGASIHETFEFIGSDAANIACILQSWNVRVGHIGSTLGDDRRGHLVARQLHEQHIQGEVRFSKDLVTPYEINVSDRTGSRTYFWKRDSEVLKTLETADLSLLDGARLLYLDWYDGDSIVRAMDEAAARGVAVFLNLEHGHEDSELLARCARHANICQIVTDETQTGNVDPSIVARKLLQAGVETVLVTLADDGCLAVRHDEVVRVWAPQVEIMDGCCAGAVFSAGFIYGYLNDWSLLRCAQFATTAATLSCTRIGPQVSSVAEIQSLAEQTEVECENQ